MTDQDAQSRTANSRPTAAERRLIELEARLKSLEIRHHDIEKGETHTFKRIWQGLSVALIVFGGLQAFTAVINSDRIKDAVSDSKERSKEIQEKLKSDSEASDKKIDASLQQMRAQVNEALKNVEMDVLTRISIQPDPDPSVQAIIPVIRLAVQTDKSVNVSLESRFYIKSQDEKIGQLSASRLSYSGRIVDEMSQVGRKFFNNHFKIEVTTAAFTQHTPTVMIGPYWRAIPYTLTSGADDCEAALALKDSLLSDTPLGEAEIGVLFDKSRVAFPPVKLKFGKPVVYDNGCN